jgi:hypothetical protein
MSKESLPPTKAVSLPIESAIDSALPSSSNRATIAALGMAPEINSDPANTYPVADFVGRCFLRVCFWFDVCTSWAKKHDPSRFEAANAKVQPIQVIRASTLMPAQVSQVRSHDRER